MKCFKEHIVTHEDDEKEAALATTQNKTIPQAQDHEPVVKVGGGAVVVANNHSDSIVRCFEEAQDDRRLGYLFVKYPQLRTQLSDVFQMTLQSSNQQQSQPASHSNGRDFNRRPGFMSKGKWTQEKADRFALERLNELAAQDEGVNEFIQLCDVLLDSQEVNGGKTDLPLLSSG